MIGRPVPRSRPVYLANAGRAGAEIFKAGIGNQILPQRNLDGK